MKVIEFNAQLFKLINSGYGDYEMVMDETYLNIADNGHIDGIILDEGISIAAMTINPDREVIHVGNRRNTLSDIDMLEKCMVKSADDDNKSHLHIVK